MFHLWDTLGITQWSTRGPFGQVQTQPPAQASLEWIEWYNRDTPGICSNLAGSHFHIYPYIDPYLSQHMCIYIY